MESSSEEETAADAKTAKRNSKLAFINPFSHKSRSSTTIYNRKSPSTPDPDKVEPVAADEHKTRVLTRSHSEDVTPRVREEWGNELWNQESLKESALLLRASVDEYEKEATIQQWTDLLRVNADVSELGKLVADSKKNKRSTNEETADGLSNFSKVALEYSKMLDVVMNQSPEYAGLAWGAIRVLLVAHCNHSKLKYAVQHYLIQFGQEFGVVNQLMKSHPTQKMVEAVSEAYAAFSKFLAKAVKYYKESKLMSAVKAFGFPWETRFQLLVNQIEAAFKRVKEISSAGHLGMTLKTNQMVEMIGTGQDELRLEMRQGTIDLRQQLKIEMKDEVQALFESFDRNWISRFEQIMIQSAQNQVALPGCQEGKNFMAPPQTATIEYVESMTEEAPFTASAKSVLYLADHITKPKLLRRFRDKSFTLLQKMENDEVKLNARLRHTTTQDLQQITGLLRSPDVRDWLQTSMSSLLWVNTCRRSGLTDWATTFSTRMVEYAEKVDNMTVLYHLCGNHPRSQPISTAVVLVQSLIMQVIQQHHKKFIRKAFPFTLEHFQYVENDMEELWALFCSCCAESRAPCIWIVVDHIDNLRRGEDYDALLHGLQQLTEDDSRVFKVFISARSTGTPPAISEAAEIESESSRIATITVPKAQSSKPAPLMSKQKRIARMPDSHSDNDTVSKADIDALLHSSEEDSESGAESNKRFLVESPNSFSSPANMELLGLSDESDVSDSSMEFTQHDPFASSEESDTDIANETEEEDSGDEVFLSVPKMSEAHSALSSSESDEDLHDSSSSKPVQRPRGRSSGTARVSLTTQSSLPSFHTDDDNTN